MGETTEELRREIELTRSDLGETLDAIGDRVSPGRVIERRKNRMSNGMRSMVDRVMGKAHDVAGASHDAVGGAVGSARDLPDTVRSQTQGTPLIAGAVAFAVGFVVASAIPPSERETAAGGQLLEKAEPVKQELTHVGQEIAEHLKEPAQQAVADVTSAAKEGAQAVTESAQQSKAETMDSAHEAVASVKDEGARGA